MGMEQRPFCLVGRDHRMNTELLRRVRKNFNSEYVSREINRRNARQWVKAVRMLGDKWVYRGGAVTWGHQARKEGCRA